MDDDPVVERGVDLLAHLESDELTLAETLNRIELVTGEPRLQERILRTAAERGVIDRADTTIRVRSDRFLRFGADVTSREGSFTCRRCGSELSTGYFMQFESDELGPFGSSCIRKVTGRE